MSILASKSKVAPLTPLTVPRLELSAVLLLTRLVKFVKVTLELSAVPCTCWTDSTIVLTWIRSHPSRWKTFVANRVAKIQVDLPAAVWRHVPTSSNPADCASRGLYGDELITHHLWWHGPSWLKFPSEIWPKNLISSDQKHSDEEKISTHTAVLSPDSWDLVNRYSSWPKLLRVTAYLFKFIHACRSRNDLSTSSIAVPATLSASECSRAKFFWIKHAQTQSFPAEKRALLAGRSISSRSSIASLTSFLDDDGIMRMRGRLRNASFPFSSQHPIILSQHPLSRLIIAHTHLRALHGGVQLTLSTLRQEYWARTLVKSVIHNCIACVRERANIPTQLMGDLPAARVQRPSRSFSHCGVDYAGPIKIRASAGRGIQSRKAYISLFICLSTRAIHLELVGDYSTSAFLKAFTRFCSRGLPQSIYSDNGTTFIRADKELLNAYRAAIRNPSLLSQTASDNVTWHFLPPSAPHFEGIWEAGVRSVKQHLRRVLGDKTLTFEEFSTVLCHVEACLNSQPIAPLSDSIDDYQYLTPEHFLIGSAITAPPEPSILNLNENRLSRWQLVQQVTELFWALWSTDYINTATTQQMAKG